MDLHICVFVFVSIDVVATENRGRSGSRGTKCAWEVVEGRVGDRVAAVRKGS